jgi:predicted dehydrogenase
MTKVLLIGCGNIGALYDLNNDQVLTYARALSRKETIDVTVYDQQQQLQQQVAERYHFKTITDPLSIHFSTYDIVCIATPTTTHFAFLQKALNAQVPVIICEKPVTYNSEELSALETSYNEGNSRVLINYIRRFQPAYEELRNEVTRLQQREKITSVRINYKRGLINNASHALDLIRFLTGNPIEMKHNRITDCTYDVFPQDPTLSCVFHQTGFAIELTGHPFADYNVFDITIEFESCTVKISNAGDDWLVEYRNPALAQNLKRSGAIRDYMLPVIDLAENMFKDPAINDNFAESLQLNRQLLQILNEQTNG